jgi:cardiolipin synthase
MIQRNALQALTARQKWQLFAELRGRRPAPEEDVPVLRHLARGWVRDGRCAPAALGIGLLALGGGLLSDLGPVVAGLLLLGAVVATDWVDGYIARHFNQVSTVGKIFDPVADRLLLVTAVVCIFIDGAVPAVVFWPVIAREVLVTAAVLALAALGARRIDVTWFGKAGTFCLMFAFPLFLVASDDDFRWHDAADVAGWFFAVVGLVFAYVALCQYVPLARKALAEGRAGRTAPASG